MKLLKKLYSIHSKSGKEKKMRKFIYQWVSQNVPEAEFSCDKVGNVYIRKGKSATYPVVVAHLDQVQNSHSRDFQALEAGDIIVGYSPKSRSQQGLGADDKNGIWVALKCLLTFKVLKVAFFVSEEIGCVGSNAANMAFFNNARFVLQCDRRGAHDLINVAGWTQLCNERFINAIQPHLFGYKEADGMLTDVLTLKEKGLSVCCVNISCGYYEPHTDYEFTSIPDLMNCLDFVENIIKNCTDVYPHEYEQYSYLNKKYYDYGDATGYSKSKNDASWMEGAFRDMFWDVVKEVIEDCPSATFEEIYWYLQESHKEVHFWEDWTQKLVNDVKMSIVNQHRQERVERVEKDSDI